VIHSLFDQMRKPNLLFPQSSCLAPLAYFNPGKLYCKSSLLATLKLAAKAFKYQRAYFSQVFGLFDYVSPTLLPDRTWQRRNSEVFFLQVLLTTALTSVKHLSCVARRIHVDIIFRRKLLGTLRWVNRALFKDRRPVVDISEPGVSQSGAGL